MDEAISIVLFLFGIALIIVAGVVAHEVMETDYDKCLDSCNLIYDNPDMERACLFECGENKCVNDMTGEQNG